VGLITAELRARGHEVVAFAPRSREEAIEQVQSLDESHDALLSVGGDGTHNTMVSGLLGRSVPMLPVPAGTENVLCKAIGVPPDPVAICHTLESGKPVAVDVALANGHPFLIMSGVGFDAAVTQEVHRHRRGPIRRRDYYLPSVRLWWGYHWPRLTVEVDGRTVAENAALAIVGNMQLYADKLHICADAMPTDGLLDICVFTKPGRWHLLRYFLLTKAGRHTRCRDVVYRQGKRIVVRPLESDVPYQVDGDAIATAPVEYTIRPGGIRLFARVAL
jgi:diacylglycerol kinase (ATP)